MTTTMTTGRDDLFTHIHKALRLGLFELTTAVGRTDWDDPAQVTELGARWRPLLELLRCHTAHEDDHIFRLLDAHAPLAVEAVTDQHRDLDDLLEDLADQFEAILSTPDPAAGLRLYRDVARFVAGYLPHLYDEETRVMGLIWERCTDDEIAEARVRFIADTTPAVMTTTLEYLLPAVDSSTRRSLVAGAPPAVREMVLTIAERVLAPTHLATLRAAAFSHA